MAWEYRRFVEALTCSHTHALPTNRASMGITYCKAGAALRKRLRYAQNCSLGARVLRRSPFFGELPSYGGFSFGASTEMKIPPKAYFSPAKYRKIVPPSLFYGIFAVIFAKAHWGEK